jgi:hypothetical protein
MSKQKNSNLKYIYIFTWGRESNTRFPKEMVPGNPVIRNIPSDIEGSPVGGQKE